MYGTGGGTLTTDALPRLTLTGTATVEDCPRRFTFAGIAPGLVQGAFQNTIAYVNSPFVFKITPDGQMILWYVFVGNGGWDAAGAVAVDTNGSAVITGVTRNPDFPLKNAFQTQVPALMPELRSHLARDRRELQRSTPHLQYCGLQYAQPLGQAGVYHSLRTRQSLVC
jgi:hypothetical protein